MFTSAKGTVVQILSNAPELQELLVEISGHSQLEKAYNYPELYRELMVGDEVWLNTNAVKLGLGTGGRHFVIPESRDCDLAVITGHIMKLRYTPWQFPVLAAEEEASPHHLQLRECVSLKNTPIVAAPLHSMLPGIILGFRHTIGFNPKVAYVMTDGAALPIALSNMVRDLKTKDLLQATVTAGHAFGGDYEAVSIPSALAIATEIIQADLVVCGLGPGIVGTGTALGFSGIEQSWILDLTARLGGIPIAVPRISTADPRERHYGLSHHSTTILNLTNQPVMVGLSTLMPEAFMNCILEKSQANHLLQRHHWYQLTDPAALDLFTAKNIRVTSMGRGITEDPWFFQSSVTAGVLAAKAKLGQLASLIKL